MYSTQKYTLQNRIKSIFLSAELDLSNRDHLSRNLSICVFKDRNGYFGVCQKDERHLSRAPMLHLSTRNNCKDTADSAHPDCLGNSATI